MVVTSLLEDEAPVSSSNLMAAALTVGELGTAMECLLLSCSFRT